MSIIKNIVYLYIPNSVPAKKEEMLRVVNARSVEELYGDITESIRFKCKINLPKPLLAEAELVQYIEELLGKNTNAREKLSFLGAGCWQHHVPAVCDEISSRGEFLTAYAGESFWTRQPTNQHQGHSNDWQGNLYHCQLIRKLNALLGERCWLTLGSQMWMKF
jgi:hypothetical protein